MGLEITMGRLRVISHTDRGDEVVFDSDMEDSKVEKKNSRKKTTKNTKKKGLSNEDDSKKKEQE